MFVDGMFGVFIIELRVKLGGLVFQEKWVYFFYDDFVLFVGIVNVLLLGVVVQFLEMFGLFCCLYVKMLQCLIDDCVVGQYQVVEVFVVDYNVCEELCGFLYDIVGLFVGVVDLVIIYCEQGCNVGFWIVVCDILVIVDEVGVVFVLGLDGVCCVVI